jgi:hypothetical protein
MSNVSRQLSVYGDNKILTAKSEDELYLLNKIAHKYGIKISILKAKLLESVEEI